MNINSYLVILAGGKGERLWPLSRQTKPKQLLPFEQNSTLLEQTINRVKNLVPQKNIWIVTTKQHEATIQALVGSQVGTIIANHCLAIRHLQFYIHAYVLNKKTPTRW